MLKELGLNGTLVAAIVQFIILLTIPAIALIVIGYFIIKSRVKKN